MPSRILIVEDDADTRLGLSVRLRASGFEPIVAVDCNSAMMKARSEQPDLILLDLGLPAGDGFVVLDRLKANINTSRIPVIVLSARDSSVNRPKAIAQGAEAYFEKPAESSALLAEIRKHLGDELTPSAMPHAPHVPKVLVVEDDADTRRCTGLRLKASGYEAVYATDGMSAIVAATREKPDVILLDLGLPAGDGFTVLKRLAVNPSLCSIPVVVLSGRNATQTSEQVRELGAREFLQKPVDNVLLLDALARHTMTEALA